MGNEQTDDISVSKLLLDVDAHQEIGANDVLRDSGFRHWCIADNIPLRTWLIINEETKKSCFSKLGKDANHIVLYIDQSLQLIVLHH